MYFNPMYTPKIEVVLSIYLQNRLSNKAKTQLKSHVESEILNQIDRCSAIEKFSINIETFIFSIWHIAGCKFKVALTR